MPDPTDSRSATGAEPLAAPLEHAPPAHGGHVHGPGCSHGHHHHAPLAPVRAAPRVGRNDPCPCGSGKKHKKCCGA